MRLGDFAVLSFDCYGTLIDWESGIHAALQPLLRKAGLTLSRDAALETFAKHESAQEAETPDMVYSDLLATVHRRLAKQWQTTASEQDHLVFGASVPQWPEFPDSAAALQYLKQHYKLVILSNVDRESFAGSNVKLGVDFDAICTAQDVGSYKPDPRNFRYLIDTLAKLGFGQQQILHTAQSLYHDHAPAKALGLASAWIDRRHERQGGGATLPPAGTPAYDFRFESLADMVASHQQEV